MKRSMMLLFALLLCLVLPMTAEAIAVDSGVTVISVPTTSSTEESTEVTYPAVPFTGTVNTAVNVRSEPSTYAVATGKLTAGTAVEILQIETDGNNDWGQIDTGWILMDYVTVNEVSIQTGGSCGENLTWTLDETTGTLTISGEGEMENYNAANEAPWYDYQDQIKEVIIEKGITNVGNYAFSGWYQEIERITLGDSIERIGNWAFYSCGGLTDHVNIPDSVKHIGTCAFMNCDALSGITLGSGVESIDDMGFGFCWEIAGKLSLPNGLRSLGHGAFQGCKKITEIEWGKGLELLDCQAFCECAGLSGDIVLPDSVVTIDSNPFRECPDITSITFGKNLAYLGDSENSLSTLFYGCNNLTEITFTGATVPVLYGLGFIDMPALETVWVPTGSLDTYTTALKGKLPEGAQIKETDDDDVGDDSASLQWFFNKLEDPDNLLWATGYYARLMEKYGD